MATVRQTKQVTAGEVLADIRTTHNLDGYEELARMTGLDRSNLWNIEHGEKNLTVRTATLIEHALGLDPGALGYYAHDATEQFRAATIEKRCFLPLARTLAEHLHVIPAPTNHTAVAHRFGVTAVA